jgi:Mce-associated membrane protein
VPTYRRTGPGQGSPQGIRRPRVAGLRKRGSQSSPADAPSPPEDPAVADSPDSALTHDEESVPEATGEPEVPSVQEDSEPEGAEPEQTVVVRDGVVGVEEPDSVPRSEAPEPSAPVLPEEPAVRVRSGNRSTIVAAVLLVLAVVCGVLAFWFHSEVQALSDEGPGANEVLVDPAATSEVNGQVTDAVQKVFSYDFADTGKTERAAKDLLVGPAIQEYEQLFTTVKQQAPQQKLVVTTTVKSSGVTRLQGDRGEVLLFVDQNAVRTDIGRNNVGPAQILVGVEKQGDQWKINRITQL